MIFEQNITLSVLMWILIGLLFVLAVLKSFPYAKNWVEKFMFNAINQIVNNFWEQQSKRYQESRRENKKKKKLENDKRTKESFSHGILLDTSILIDGRILDIVKTGFLDSTLIIPKGVIDELHLISDSDDKLKREKGRRGLDMVKDLKQVTKVIIFNQKVRQGEVDKELVNLARKFKIRLMTLDFNLNKVAGVSGVHVLNINELVNAVKTVVLPGEMLKVKIVQEGKEKDQGVGYMADGTMIVVEGAKQLVGEELDAKVARVIQTNAGKMIFCSYSQISQNNKK
jgi:uncharacterized protein YacL